MLKQFISKIGELATEKHIEIFIGESQKVEDLKLKLAHANDLLFAKDKIKDEAQHESQRYSEECAFLKKSLIEEKNETSIMLDTISLFPEARVTYKHKGGMKPFKKVKTKERTPFSKGTRP